MRALQSQYEMGDFADFERQVQATLEAYPHGALLQVAVADAAGSIIYSNLTPKSTPKSTTEGTAPQPTVSIADREHFQVHQLGRETGLFVSKPVQGKISHQWTLQLTRALRPQGQFAGVLVLSVSPDFIASNFRHMTEGSGDIIALVRSDGAYLARSQLQQEVLGLSTPPERVDLFASDPHRGRYTVSAPVDGVVRMYAWTRVPDTALIVSAGLERSAVFAPVQGFIARSLRRDALASALVLLGSGLIVWLAVLRQRSDDQQSRNAQHFAQLVQEVPGGLFQYRRVEDQRGDFVFVSPGFYALHGLQPLESAAHLRTHMAQRVHPEDWPTTLASVTTSIRSASDWDHSYRVIDGPGAVRWLHGHAHCQRDADGTPLWYGYVYDITHTRALQEAVAASENRLRLALQAVGDGLWEMDCRSGALHWDERCYTMLGYAPQAFALDTQLLQSLIHPADGARWREQLQRHLDEGSLFQVEIRIRTQAKDWRWIQTRGEVVERDAQGQALRMLGTHMDIDARHRAESALQQTQARLEALIGHFPAGIIVADTKGETILGVNAQAVQILGLIPPSPQAQEGSRLSDLPLPLPVLDMHGCPAACPSAKEVLTLDDGRCIEVQALALQGQEGAIGQCWILNDITERRQREQQLKTLALTDALTAIPNRRAFGERLEMELSHLQSALVQHAAVILLDIDHFKRVNDSYGHAVGDKVLQALAATVVRELRKDDMVGRIGGEEFAVLLTATDAPTGLRRAERLRQAIAATAVDIGHETPLHFTVSLGVYPLQPGEPCAATCMNRADKALYHAKRHGRNQTALWQEGM